MRLRRRLGTGRRALRRAVAVSAGSLLVAGCAAGPPWAPPGCGARRPAPGCGPSASMVPETGPDYLTIAYRA